MPVGTFAAPVYATAAPGEPANLYVVEQAGRIMVLQSGKIRATPFLDIRRLVRAGGEQGLLSVAFDPDYVKNRRFYVDYTDVHGDTRVVRYTSNGTTAIRLGETAALRQGLRRRITTAASSSSARTSGSTGETATAVAAATRSTTARTSPVRSRKSCG